MEVFVVVISILICVILIWKKKAIGKATKPDVVLSFTCTLIDDEYDINVGDKVTLWPKPDSNDIHIYHRRSVAGLGLLGKLKSPYLAKNYPSSTYRVKSTIAEIRGNTVILDNKLEIVDKREEEKKSTERFLAELEKPFVPKEPINVIFYMPDDFQWNTKVELVIGNLKKGEEQVSTNSDWSLILEEFWLCYPNGEKASVENYTKRGDIIQLIRAIRSGYSIALKYQKGFRDKSNEKGGQYMWTCSLS